MPAASSPLRRPPLGFIFLITVSGILANSVISPNIPDILADLGQPSDRAGLLVSISPLPGIFMAPVVGLLADRFGRRRILLPCLVLFGFAAMAAALAPTFELLLAARFVQGIGGAGLVNLAVVIISDNWDGLERTKRIGQNSAVLTVCLAVIPSIAGLIGERFGWRYAVGIGVLALPIAVAGVFVLDDVRPGLTTTYADQLRASLRVIRQPQLLTFFLSGVLLFVVVFGVFLTALPVHLEEDFGLAAGSRGLLLSVSAVGSTVAAFNLGRIRSVTSIRPLLVGSCGFVALAAAAVALAPSVAVMIPALLLYGVGDGIAIPALQDLASAAAPTAQRAAVIAVWVSCVRLGQFLGPLASAAVFGATSTTVAMLLGAFIFGLLALFLVVAPLEPAEGQVA